MNPPPDKKRKKGRGEWERGSVQPQTDVEDPEWGDDYTENDLICLSQLEVNPDQTLVPHSEISGQQSFHPQPQPSTSHHQQSLMGAGEPKSTPQPAFSNELQKRLERTQKDFDENKKELKNLKDELLVKEGEVAMQRDTVQRKEAEILKYKHERMQQLDFEKQERGTKEKQLKGDVDRLEGQMQFKEQELLEMQKRCRNLELQISKLDGSAATTSKLSTQSPRLNPVERRSPRKSPQANYPTMETFRAKMSSKPSKDKSTCTDFPRSVEETTSINTIRKPLSLQLNNGKLSGPCLVGNLLESEESCTKGQITPTPPGIIRLLQYLQPPPINLSSFHLERDASSLLFSPKPLKRSGSQRSTHGSQSLGSQDELAPLTGVLTKECMALATRGLIGMLSSDTQLTVKLPTVSQSQSSENSPTIESAIFLLPLINGYLGHYIDMLTVTMETSILSSPNSSFRTSNTSGSDSSSFNSVSSSLNMLLKDGAAYANTLEELTVAALNVLRKLCNHYREVAQLILCKKNENFIVGRTSNGSQTSPEMEIDPTIQVQQTKESSPENGELSAHGELSAPSSESSNASSIIESPIPDIHLLPKLLRLADPGNENGVLHNQKIAELTLDILHSLTLSAETDQGQIESLSPLLMTGVFHNCLSPDTSQPVMFSGLQLLAQLLKLDTISNSLCRAPDGCLLLCLYQLCQRGVPNKSQRCYEQLIDCLSHITSLKKNGCVKMLDTNCACNHECVKGIVTLQHSLLTEYNSITNNLGILQLLKRGVTLLHNLYLHDASFENHHEDIQHSYVSLICGLSSIYNHVPGINDHDLAALNDLLDFEDDWDYSQGEDTDDTVMEVE